MGYKEAYALNAIDNSKKDINPTFVVKKKETDIRWVTATGTTSGPQVFLGHCFCHRQIFIRHS